MSRNEQQQQKSKNEMSKKPKHKTKITQFPTIHIAHQRLFTFSSNFFFLFSSLFWLNFFFSLGCELNSCAVRFISFRCAQNLLRKSRLGPLLALHGIFKSHIVCYSRWRLHAMAIFFLFHFSLHASRFALVSFYLFWCSFAVALIFICRKEFCGTLRDFVCASVSILSRCCKPFVGSLKNSVICQFLAMT